MPKEPTNKPELEVKPDPNLEKRTRRTFSAEYKLRIIKEADACKHGELGPLLRHEKLYSNQLADWRREFSENGVAGLQKSSPGPAPLKTPEQKEIERLQRQVSKLYDELGVAQDCIDIQKKCCRFSIVRTMGIRSESCHRTTASAFIVEVSLRGA